jgi:hypothetical protein
MKSITINVLRWRGHMQKLNAEDIIKITLKYISFKEEGKKKTKFKWIDGVVEYWEWGTGDWSTGNIFGGMSSDLWEPQFFVVSEIIIIIKYTTYFFVYAAKNP